MVCVCVCLFVCLHVCLYWCAGLSAETWYKENNGFLCKQRTKRISKIKLQLCPESPGSKNANKITRTPPPPVVLLLARCAPKISARKCRRVAHGLAHLARRGRRSGRGRGNCLCVLSFDLGRLRGWECVWSGGLANSVHYDSLERRPAKQLAKSHFPLSHKPGQARPGQEGCGVLQGARNQQ